MKVLPQLKQIYALSIILLQKFWVLVDVADDFNPSSPLTTNETIWIISLKSLYWLSIPTATIFVPYYFTNSARFILYIIVMVYLCAVLVLEAGELPY